MLFELIQKLTGTDDRSSWKIIYNRFKPAQEGLREAICALGNGYFVTRGAAPEVFASDTYYPGTYMAGVYNKLPTTIAGKTIFNEDLVNCPNWLFLSFRIGKGDWINFSTTKVISYYQELDMHSGVLFRKIRLQDHLGQITKIETERFVHIQDHHCAAMKYSITPENYSAVITVRSALDGSVQNTGVERYRQLNSKHLKLKSLGAFDKNGICLSVKTSQSNIEICQAAKLRVFINDNELIPTIRAATKEKKLIFQEFEIAVKEKQRCDIEKNVFIYTSKDKDIKEPLIAAKDSAKNSPNFDSLLQTHRRCWSSLWRKFDIKLEGDVFSQKIIRLHIFHLLQTASKHNTEIDAGLPARGLHGEAYRGHIFWDGIFTMPFYDFHAPEIAKSLILYRYRRLNKAREYAKQHGYRGAMFPWQSGSTGEEETQTIHLNPISGEWGQDYSSNQRHVSFAIAYNVWKHWERTLDTDFLAKYGAEILLSIAQFGASLAKYSLKDHRYHIEGVMGPDEFHEKLPNKNKSGLRDNAYTNLMIAWTLLKAQDVLNILSAEDRERIINKIGLENNELRRWEDISKRMNIVFNDDNIIAQFDGYFGLKELDWDIYRAAYGGKIERMDRILKAEGDSPDNYKVSKQADALMIFYLLSFSEIKSLFQRLGYKIDKDILEKNYDYYTKRTTHGSTLSKVSHCYLAHLLGKTNDVGSWFLEILKSDIYDTQGGTAPEGIHMGVMGGSIVIVMMAFAGVEIEDGKVKINPSLPKNWQSLSFKFYYRKLWFSLLLKKDEITIFIEGVKQKILEFPVEIRGEVHNIPLRKNTKVPIN